MQRLNETDQKVKEWHTQHYTVAALMILNIACIATTKHFENLFLYEQQMGISMYLTGNIFVLLIFKNYQDVWYLKRVTYHRLQ